MRGFDRFRPAAVFLIAVLAGAVPAMARAQDQTQTEAPAGNGSDYYVDESQNQNSVFQSLRDFSSYGASLGGMKLFGGDLGSKSKIRPIMQGVFRYRFSDKWIATGEFGFGWNSFQDQGDTVLTFNFGTLGAARRFTRFAGVDIRASAGAGIYRWNYKYHGHSLRDAGTYRFYRGMAPGGFLGLEGEYRVTQHVTVLTFLQNHYILTANSDKYDYLFDRNHGFLSFRLGASYHFSPYEGILWESKERKTIRLESGKAGQ